jgi:tight adherence protein C
VTATSSGALVGLLAALGLVLVTSWLRARRPPAMVDRIGPFVGLPGSAFEGRARFVVTPASLLTLLRTGWGDSAADRDLEVRLRRSGSTATTTQYRLERIVCLALGAAAGALVGILLGGGQMSPMGTVLLGVFGGIAGWAGRDALLRRTVRRRRRIIESQLPTLADLLALAVAAGASPVAALDHVSRTMAGPLADEVADAIADVHSGVSVDVALRSLADLAGLVAVQRFVEGVLIALERGSPLAEVLRAQAADARAEEQRRLMELAGRKDIAMLVPIVFLVLPSVILIAVFPGLQALRIVVP